MKDEEKEQLQMRALLEAHKANIEENHIAFRARILAEKFQQAAKLLRGMDGEGCVVQPEAFADVAALDLPSRYQLEEFAAEAEAAKQRWKAAQETKRSLGLV